MDYLPISLSIENKPCLVVGGGNIALRKAKQLLAAGANLTVIAKDFHNEFDLLREQESQIAQKPAVDLSGQQPNSVREAELSRAIPHSQSKNATAVANRGSVTLVRRGYIADDVTAKLMVIAATDDLEVNQQVFNDAERLGVLVNVVDQPQLCRFITPSVIDRTPLTIAISSGGSGPVLARMLREKIEWWLPHNIGPFLSKINLLRPEVSKQLTSLQQRKRFWEKLFEAVLGWNTIENVADSSSSDNLAEEDNLNSYADLEHLANASSASDTNTSFMTFVDFGSANIAGLTVAAINALRKADRVYLSASNYILLQNLIRRDADIIQLDENKITDQLAERHYAEVAAQPSSHFVYLRNGSYFEEFRSFNVDSLASSEEFGNQKIVTSFINAVGIT